MHEKAQKRKIALAFLFMNHSSHSISADCHTHHVCLLSRQHFYYITYYKRTVFSNTIGDIIGLSSWWIKISILIIIDDL